MVRGLGLPKDRLLEWSVEDGWQPLCNFLGKPIPAVDVPNANPPKAWAERVAKTMEIHHKRAAKNMLIFGAFACIVVYVVLCAF